MLALVLALASLVTLSCRPGTPAFKRIVTAPLALVTFVVLATAIVVHSVPPNVYFTNGVDQKWLEAREAAAKAEYEERSVLPFLGRVLTFGGTACIVFVALLEVVPALMSKDKTAKSVFNGVNGNHKGKALV